MTPITRPSVTSKKIRNNLRISGTEILQDFPRKGAKVCKARRDCALVVPLRLCVKLLLATGLSSEAAVVDVAGELAWQFEIVVDDIFEVDARRAGVGEQGHEGRFAFVLFVFGDAPVVHRVRQSESLEHLRL